METRSPSLREKVRQLRQTFLGKLPLALGDARQLCDSFARSPGEASIQNELFRIFHSIKGTSSSFGLIEISAAAALAEKAVLALQGVAGSDRKTRLPDILGTLVTHITTIETLVRAANANGPDATGPVDAPSFAMLPADTRQGGKRIFICDDDEIQLETLTAQLSCFGYSVTAFMSPISLRAAVLAAPPDAVVMDIMFPDSVIGTEVAASLQRDMTNPPPMIFISSRRDFDARLRAVQAAGQAYFAKPVKAIDLVEMLDSLTLGQEPEPFRILIVDDEPEVASYHAFILEQTGMTTRLLHHPDTILSVLSEFKPDLVLMDMYMPTCTGRDLSRLIRQVPEFISLPIIFLSSETDKSKQVSALRVGAEGFLTKPIQPDDLISAVAIRAERMRTLRSLMVRDSLTGLFNHTFMLQFLDTVLASARRDSGQVSFAMIDVDNFKKVNDTHGHPAGDQVLVALARLLQQRLRKSDMVGRYGGEEFAIILQDITPEEAFRVLDDLRSDFSKIQFQAADNDFSCTFSVGLASFTGAEPLDRLLELADQALYQAKNSGRNRTVAAQ